MRNFVENMIFKDNKIKNISFFWGIIISFIIPNYAIANSVVISWDANSEPDLLGYKIYYGTSSRSYNSMIDVRSVLEYTINNLSNGLTYYFAITAYDTALNESNYSKEAVIRISDEGVIVVEQFELLQNYPNPFNPMTEIRFQLPKDIHVSINIYNILGQKVRTLVDKNYTKGYHSVYWDAMDEQSNPVLSGFYFYKIQAGSFVEMKKMTLLR